jgi:probable H4MPT-linked C1 transfer pathway protein
VAVAVKELAPARTWLYAGPAGLVTPDETPAQVRHIASANWHASATLVARSRNTALFMDMGSTTTDIVPAAGGKIQARGYTDAERLAAGELVYTGLVRSFIMAVSDRAPFAGAWTLLVNENFANMGDAYRILGMLPEDSDQMTTADGREKTVAASRARLARMIGCDEADADGTGWEMLAQWLAERQMRVVIDGAMLVLSTCALPRDAPVVGAGIGEVVLREAARRLGRDYIAFESLLDVSPQARPWASHCAPAAALALLANDCLA